MTFRPYIMDAQPNDRVRIGTFSARVVQIRPTDIEVVWDANGEHAWIPRHGCPIDVELIKRGVTRPLTAIERLS